MLMRFKKIDRSPMKSIIHCLTTGIATLVIAGFFASVSAQVTKPAKPANGGANAPKGGATAPAGKGVDNAASNDQEKSSKNSATESALDYLFNRRPEDGSAAAQGSGVASVLGDRAIADDALGGVGNQIDPEFESFLNSQEQNLELAESYATMLDDTIGHLREGKAYDAIANLYVLGRYSWDARQ